MKQNAFAPQSFCEIIAQEFPVLRAFQRRYDLPSICAMVMREIPARASSKRSPATALDKNSTAAFFLPMSHFFTSLLQSTSSSNGHKRKARAVQPPRRPRQALAASCLLHKYILVHLQHTTAFVCSCSDSSCPCYHRVQLVLNRRVAACGAGGVGGGGGPAIK